MAVFNVTFRGTFVSDVLIEADTAEEARIIAVQDWQDDEDFINGLLLTSLAQYQDIEVEQTDDYAIEAANGSDDERLKEIGRTVQYD